MFGKEWKEIVGRFLFTSVVIMATIWLASQIIDIDWYLELGRGYIGVYLFSERNDAWTYAGEILVNIGYCSALLLIGLGSTKLIGGKETKRGILVLLIIIGSAIFFSFFLKIQEGMRFKEVAYTVQNIPWIFLSVIGIVSAILAEIYFLLVRPLRRKRT